MALGGCAHPPSTTSAAPVVDEAQVARLIPPRRVDRALDRAGWAAAILVAIRLAKKEPTAERVCAVLAIIEQESGYQEDPAVADLPRIVRTGIEAKLAALGPLKGPALDEILAVSLSDGTTFGARIQRLKTERDLDRLFREVGGGIRARAPGSFAVASALSALLGKGSFDDLNPVTTAGSMQVKVSFARSQGKAEGLSDDDVRELLYTRQGGVRFGTARLIG